jgi:hypothetical protein
MAIATIAVIVLAIAAANTTLTTQRVSTTIGSTSSADPTGLAQDFASQIKAFLVSGEFNDDPSVTIAAALLPATMAASTEEMRDAVREINITQIEVGTGQWNGRSLPGEIVTIEIQTVNRRQGKYSRVCLQQAGLTDAEFRMLRDVRTLECNSTGEGLMEWRSEARFSSNHRGAEVATAPTL